ncbi:MAG: tetratricopeptide repeat protein [Deltaproteobacteria bacterium]|nr:tetratricopeptide repeat protein [Deltaproteobacteria bacterium]
MNMANTFHDEPAPRAPTDDRPRYTRYAVLASASFFGELVEETFVDRGRMVQIGNTDAMALPVPEGQPWLARVDWHSPTQASVLDGRGEEHLLTPDQSVVIETGPVMLTLSLVPRYLLRRTEDIQWWGSLAWFTVVFAATLLSWQGNLLYAHRCDWFGIDCQMVSVGSGVGGMYTAEYLARLLREDYAGSEEGTLERGERETGARENESFYLPAGSEGPITEMGGAADTAPEEIRIPQSAEEDELAAAEQVTPLVAEEGVGVPVPALELSDAVGDAVADGMDAGEDEKTVDPAEDKEGWGVQDWYDAQDRALEALEIEIMLREARQRLRIDPNDPEALSVLSYYQYLAQDYASAERTYEKFIRLYPDASAGYNNKALIYKRKGQYKKEEGLYRVALALAPDDETALNNLAVCLAHQGRYNEALIVMRRLETIDPDDPYADLHRSKIHAEIGEDERALEYLERALQGMATLDTLHHIEFRQDIRIDPSFEKLRHSRRFHAILLRYYGNDSPLQE